MSHKATDGRDPVKLNEGKATDQDDDTRASEDNDLCIKRLWGLGKTDGVLKYFVKVPFLW